MPTALARIRDAIRDAFGVPVPTDVEPPKTAFMNRNIADIEERWRGYVSRDPRPARITQILNNADSGDPRELFEFQEEMIEKDPKIRSVFQTRKASILGLQWEVVAADAEVGEEELADEIAQNVERWIKRSNLREMRAHQLDALMKPFAVSHIEWPEIVDTDGQFRRVPGRFTPVNGRKFRWSDKTDELLFYPNQATTKGIPLEPRSTIRSLFNVQADHPTRAGFGRGLIWYYAFKAQDLRNWVIFGEKYGMPVRILQIARTDFDNPEYFDRMQASLRNLGANGSGVFDLESKLEIVATPSDGAAFQLICDYMDKAIAQAVLGHELASQGGTGAGPAFGQNAARDVRQDILEDDCEQYAAQERRDVYEPLTTWNYGFDKAHLTPHLRFHYEPPEDETAWIKNVSVACRTFDMPVSKQQLRKRLGMDIPVDFDVDKEEDAAFARQPVSPFGGGFGGPGEEIPDEDETEDDNGVDNGDAAGPRAVAASSEGAHTILLGASTSQVALAPSQRTVDRITERGIDRATSELLAMRAPIKRLIRHATRNGWSSRQLLEGVTQLYRQLDLRTTEKANAAARLYARLLGKTAKAKRGN